MHRMIHKDQFARSDLRASCAEILMVSASQIDDVGERKARVSLEQSAKPERTVLLTKVRV